MKPSLHFLKRLTKQVLSFSIFTLIISSLFFLHPQRNEAAAGGRIGGGEFRTPSVPQGGGYRNNYGGSGDFGGGYGARRIGFPFLFPIFGFGGGGLFGFLILMAISGVIVNSIRGNNYNLSRPQESASNIDSKKDSITIIQLQIGLLASAKELQENLRELANNANTSTSEGLQYVLQETTLSLLRQPELWVYANIESGRVPFISAETTFNRLSLSERSKLREETTSNFSGKIVHAQSNERPQGEAALTSEFIAITILIASKNQPAINTSINNDQLQENLKILGAISSNDLTALEVIWQPEGKGESLSSEELVISYPNLKHL